jgi:hypothetical protein
MYRVLRAIESHGTPKLWAIAHENTHKRENDVFLVMYLKHVRVLWALKIAL